MSRAVAEASSDTLTALCLLICLTTDRSRCADDGFRSAAISSPRTVRDRCEHATIEHTTYSPSIQQHPTTTREKSSIGCIRIPKAVYYTAPTKTENYEKELHTA